jgi:hypothetical protein
MTINQLLDFDLEKLQAMSDEELLEYFKPYLQVTRPDMVTIQKSVNAAPKFKKLPMSEQKRAKYEAAQKIFDQLGLKVKL